MYRNITVKAKYEWDLQHLNVIPLPTENLRYARGFHVISDFHEKLKQRCLHHIDDDELEMHLTDHEDSGNEEDSHLPDRSISNDEEESTEPHGFDRLTASLMPLLERLEDQALTSFR